MFEAALSGQWHSRRCARPLSSHPNRPTVPNTHRSSAPASPGTGCIPITRTRLVPQPPAGRRQRRTASDLPLPGRTRRRPTTGNFDDRGPVEALDIAFRHREAGLDRLPNRHPRVHHYVRTNKQRQRPGPRRRILRARQILSRSGVSHHSEPSSPAARISGYLRRSGLCEVQTCSLLCPRRLTHVAVASASHRRSSRQDDHRRRATGRGDPERAQEPRPDPPGREHGFPNHFGITGALLLS